MSSTPEVPSKRKSHFDDEPRDDVKRNKLESNFPIQKNAPCEVIQAPTPGTIVNRREFRRVGPYILGPKLGHSAVESISQYLAKKENSDEFVQVKILHLLSGDTSSKTAVMNESQAKMLLHTEFSLLSLLENENGVIRHHGMFSDIAYEEENTGGQSGPRYTGKLKKRLVFVLDCVTSHEYSRKSKAFVSLQQYSTKDKKLPEPSVLHIFYEIISVVENLHKRNIIHRDLKLGNIVLNKTSNKIIITNFCLGKYLLNENDLLYDQRGSPAYISPDVLCGPHLGKPSDIWALGVVLFTMLCGRFPFYESTPPALFRKIRAADYVFPSDVDISSGTQRIIQGILVLRPDQRLTAKQVRERVGSIIFAQPQMRQLDQLVPTLPTDERKKTNSAVNRRIPPANVRSDQVVPHVVNQQSTNQGLTRNCSVPLTPISQSFLRPSSRLSLQNNRLIRPITQNEVNGQVQFIIFNNPARNRTGNGTSDAPNWQATIRFQNQNGGNSQMTQQMRNLTLRNRQELTRRAWTSWHDVVRNESGSTPPQPVVNNSNNTEDTASTRRVNVEPERDLSTQSALSPASGGSQLSVDTIQPLLHLFNRMFCMSDEESHDIHNASSQLVPNGSPSSNHLSIPNPESLERILQAINNTFIRGRVPQPRQPFMNFDGTITEDLATKICTWLITNYREHRVIHRVFGGNTDNAIGKVQAFLTRCGVDTLTVDGVVNIKRDQSFELLLVAAYLLQASGYTHNYLFS